MAKSSPFEPEDRPRAEQEAARNAMRDRTTNTPGSTSPDRPSTYGSGGAPGAYTHDNPSPDARSGISDRGAGNQSPQAREARETSQDAAGAIARAADANVRAMSNAASSPFALMHQFSGEMDRMMESLMSFGPMSMSLAPMTHAMRTLTSAPWAPQVDVSESGDRLVVCVDVPGVAREDLELRLEPGMLTIRGERRERSESQDGGSRRSEQRYGGFYRTVPLPRGADADNANASLQDGVLRLEIPVRRETSARSIPIGTGARP